MAPVVRTAHTDRSAPAGSLAKADRAPLHERFATALEAEAGDRRDEFAEILAHHAEQAFTLSYAPPPLARRTG